MGNRKRASRRNTITFIIMAVMLVVAVSTTIVLAAFTAQKTSSATLTFANGLQLKLDPITPGAAIKITSAPAQVTGTFSYSGTMTGLSDSVTMDGIKATLINQNGYVAYSVILKEGGSAVSGSWSALSSSVSTFTPDTGETDWQAKLTLPSGWALVETPNSSTIKVKRTAIINVNTPTHLFTSIVFEGASTASNVTSLAGRSIVLEFNIVADTAGVPTI